MRYFSKNENVKSDYNYHDVTESSDQCIQNIKPTDKNDFDRMCNYLYRYKHIKSSFKQQQQDTKCTDELIFCLKIKPDCCFSSMRNDVCVKENCFMNLMCGTGIINIEFE